MPRSLPLTAANTQVDFTVANLNPDGSVMTALPSNAAGAGVAPVASRDVTGLVVRNAPSNFYGGSMTAGTTVGFFILYNATSIPAGGAALTAALTLAVVPVGVSGFASIGGNSPVPIRCSVGAVLLFSTAVTTYTVPATPAVHMTGSGV